MSYQLLQSCATHKSCPPYTAHFSKVTSPTKHCASQIYHIQFSDTNNQLLPVRHITLNSQTPTISCYLFNISHPILKHQQSTAACSTHHTPLSNTNKQLLPVQHTILHSQTPASNCYLFNISHTPLKHHQSTATCSTSHSTLKHQQSTATSSTHHLTLSNTNNQLLPVKHITLHSHKQQLSIKYKTNTESKTHT